MSLNKILKFFLNFGRFEPCDSYKLYSYKKESMYSEQLAKYAQKKETKQKMTENI